MEHPVRRPPAKDKPPAKPRVSAVARGALIEFATDRLKVYGFTSSARAQLLEAGYLETFTPPLAPGQSLEEQVETNRKALKELQEWAKNACPKNPFPSGKVQYDPGVMIWQKIQQPVAYRSCLTFRVSSRGWEYLKTLGISQPTEEEKKKPCASGGSR